MYQNPERSITKTKVRSQYWNNGNTVNGFRVVFGLYSLNPNPLSDEGFASSTSTELPPRTEPSGAVSSNTDNSNSESVNQPEESIQKNGDFPFEQIFDSSEKISAQNATDPHYLSQIHIVNNMKRSEHMKITPKETPMVYENILPLNQNKTFHFRTSHSYCISSSVIYSLRSEKNT